jgi:hypothetical protein
LLARRELLKPMATRLAEAALLIQPSSDYYVIERDGRIVGGAASELDTTGFGIISRQHLFGELVEGDPEHVVVRARALYSPRLAFTSLKIELERGRDSLALNAQRVGDSVLTVSIDGLAQRDVPEQIVARDPLFLGPAAVLPLVLVESAKVGSRATVRVFDPILRRVREIPLALVAESLFVVVDSAMYDPRRRRWSMAKRDTVRAWLVASDSMTARVWVDRAGRIVEFSDGRGTRAVRTAYEIAYENWRLARER